MIPSKFKVNPCTEMHTSSEVNNMSSESIILVNSVANQLQDYRKKQQKITRLRKETAASIDMPTSPEVNNMSSESIILVNSVQDYRKKQQENFQSIPKKVTSTSNLRERSSISNQRSVGQILLQDQHNSNMMTYPMKQQPRRQSYGPRADTRNYEGKISQGMSFNKNKVTSQQQQQPIQRDNKQYQRNGIFFRTDIVNSIPQLLDPPRITNWKRYLDFVRHVTRN